MHGTSKPLRFACGFSARDPWTLEHEPMDGKYLDFRGGGISIDSRKLKIVSRRYIKSIGGES